MRIYDLDMCEEGPVYEIALADPFCSLDNDMSGRMAAMEKWANLHCDDDYVIMLGLVMFKDARDALIFKLKYG